MPNTREKLIELICSTEYGNSSLIGNNFQKGFIEKIADHLIANGVTFQNRDIHWATERAYKNGLEAGKPKWIPVTERLPENVAPYLVLSKAGNCSVQWFHIYGENFKGFFNAEEPGKITHWMPLPEAPKGE